MGLFRKTSRVAPASSKPSRAERRAAKRTERAEASLVSTEQQIHEMIADIRRDLKRSSDR